MQQQTDMDILLWVALCGCWKYQRTSEGLISLSNVANQWKKWPVVVVYSGFLCTRPQLIALTSTVVDLIFPRCAIIGNYRWPFVAGLHEWVLTCFSTKIVTVQHRYHPNPNQLWLFLFRVQKSQIFRALELCWILDGNQYLWFDVVLLLGIEITIIDVGTSHDWWLYFYICVKNFRLVASCRSGFTSKTYSILSWSEQGY